MDRHHWPEDLLCRGTAAGVEPFDDRGLEERTLTEVSRQLRTATTTAEPPAFLQRQLQVALDLGAVLVGDERSELGLVI